MFRKLDPVMYMMTSKDTGKMNSYMSVTKGEKIGVYAFLDACKRRPVGIC